MRIYENKLTRCDAEGVPMILQSININTMKLVHMTLFDDTIIDAVPRLPRQAVVEKMCPVGYDGSHSIRAVGYDTDYLERWAVDVWRNRARRKLEQMRKYRVV